MSPRGRRIDGSSSVRAGGRARTRAAGSGRGTGSAQGAAPLGDPLAPRGRGRPDSPPTASLEPALRALCEQAAREVGCELLDVTLRRSPSGPILELTVERPGGVTLEQCARVSRVLGAWLDVEALFEDRYTLEVSSPGLTRPLATPEEYRRFLGRLVLVQTRVAVEGRTRFRGHLEAVTPGDSPVIRVHDAELRRPVEIAWPLVLRGRLDFEFPRPATGHKGAGASRRRANRIRP